MPFKPKELVYCETCKVSITKAHIAAHRRSVSHRQKSEGTWTEQGLPFFCPECDKFVNKKRGHLKTASHANKARAYWESETCKLCKVSFPIRERGEHLKSESHILEEVKIGLGAYKKHLKKEYQVVLPMTAKEYLFHEEDNAWMRTDEGRLFRKHSERIRGFRLRERLNWEKIAKEYGKRGMILEKRKSEQRQLQLTRGEILSKIYGVKRGRLGRAQVCE